MGFTLLAGEVYRIMMNALTDAAMRGLEEIFSVPGKVLGWLKRRYTEYGE